MTAFSKSDRDLLKPKVDSTRLREITISQAGLSKLRRSPIPNTCGAQQNTALSQRWDVWFVEAERNV